MRTRILVTPAWVERHRDDRSVVVVEVGADPVAYDDGHIPHAVSLGMAELADPARNDVLDRASFERLLSAMGISQHHTVVLYSGADNRYAAYAYWVFRTFGHQALRLLDGGRKRWELDQRVLVRDVPVRAETRYRALWRDGSLVAARGDVLGGAACLLDVRSPQEFTGRLAAPAHLPQRQPLRRGHIPGAVNLPWSVAVAHDGTIRPDDELRKRYAAVLGEADRDTVVYGLGPDCAAHTWLVLHEILGLPKVRVYQGSWAEYGSLAGAPAATGGLPYRREPRVSRPVQPLVIEC